MPIGAPVFAPEGYLRFCERQPDQCDLAVDPADRTRRALDRAINRQQWARLLQASPQSTGTPAPIQSQTAAEATYGEAPLEAAQADAASMTDDRAPGPNSVRPVLIGLDERNWADLNRINRSINARIQPMSDEQAFGVSDYWTLPLSDGDRPFGNCKHYVLEKRKALADAGAPADALSIALVRTPSGEEHAVLIVATDRGDLVLDNLSPEIKDWRDAGYLWTARQTPGRPLDWAAVASPRPMLRF